jgi:hypothetical protein
MAVSFKLSNYWVTVLTILPNCIEESEEKYMKQRILPTTPCNADLLRKGGYSLCNHSTNHKKEEFT